MPYHPVVDRFHTIPPLDPATMLCFVAVFVAAALLTLRRPAFGAALLIFVPPFTFDHAIGGTSISIPKAVLLGVLVGLLSRRETIVKLRETRTPVLAFAAIIAAIALSAIGATYRSEVLRELLKWVEYLLFFVAAYAAFSVDPDTTIVRRSFTTSIVLTCITALAELFTGATSGLWIGSVAIPRIAGALEGPNQLAAYLEVAVAFFAAFQIDALRQWKTALLALLFLTLTLTFSRGALLGILALVLVLLLMRGRSFVRDLPGLVIGGALGGCVVLALASVTRRGFGSELIRSSDLNGDTTGGVGSRSQLWRAAWYLFRHHPVFGVGAGNYERRLSEAGLYGVRTHANSWYLQALAEGGVVLFAATIFFIVALIAQVLPRARRSTWALAALAATVALSVHQVVDYLVFFPKIAEPWFVLCAIGMAAPPEPCD